MLKLVQPHSCNFYNKWEPVDPSISNQERQQGAFLRNWLSKMRELIIYDYFN